MSENVVLGLRGQDSGTGSGFDTGILTANPGEIRTLAIQGGDGNTGKTKSQVFSSLLRCRVRHTEQERSRKEKYE